jgi:hypothetical protein
LWAVAFRAVWVFSGVIGCLLLLLQKRLADEVQLGKQYVAGTGAGTIFVD